MKEVTFSRGIPLIAIAVAVSACCATRLTDVDLKLHHAVQAEDLNGVKLALGSGANPNSVFDSSAGNTPLMFATFIGSPSIAIDVIDALLVAGAKIDKQDAGGQTALMYAIRQNQPEVVAKLLSSGANPKLADTFGRTAEEIARSKGTLAVLEAMRARGSTSKDLSFGGDESGSESSSSSP